MVDKLFLIFSFLFVPIILLFFGARFKKQAPKQINPIYGYRPMSMKNEDTWIFAHKVLGEEWIKWGKVTLLFTLIVAIFGWIIDLRSFYIIGTIFIFVQMIPFILSILTVEKQ